MANKITTFVKLVKTIRNYPTYLKDYFGKIKGQYLFYHLRNGLKYKVRGGSTDRFILNEVWIHKSYNPKGFEINQNDIVVDIGGHIGVFTILASHYAKFGKVYTFEPMKENFELLRDNIEINNAVNVSFFNKAVSDKNGEIGFFISQTKNKGQNSLQKLEESQREVVVETISFKDFLRKLPRIDFLKMDCEGGEYKILPSLSRDDFKKIKKISMEYHNYGNGTGKELKSILEKNGFKVKMVQRGEKFGTIYALNTKWGQNS